MIREVAIGWVKRALDVVESQSPQLTDGFLNVPLEAYSSESIAAADRELFETQPLALLASSEIAKPHDFHVRTAVGRSILLTRDAEGRARAFLNYCRHRGAEPARGHRSVKRRHDPCGTGTDNCDRPDLYWSTMSIVSSDGSLQ